jgi:hypothetical protein
MNAAELAWQALDRELDAWATTKQCAKLWWRDDDAIEPTLALDRMLALSARYDVPLGLAVIPGSATQALAHLLDPETAVDVLQHGLVHQNHAHAGERAAEFGAHRPLAVRLAAQAEGWARLDGFKRRVPIFVPPWNRYDPGLAPGFGLQKIVAVSTFGPSRRLPSPIVECNCHVDIISWRTTRGFAGVEKSLTGLATCLHAFRTGAAPGGEATGLLTHHLDHDAACWSFLDELFARLQNHPGARWVRPMDAVNAVLKA